VLVFQCRNCTHHFAHPELDSSQLAVYYGRAYRKHRLGPSYCELMRRRAKAQFQFIKKYLLPDAESFSEWKVIDIGCGIGALVAQLERDGALAQGYDLDPAVISFGKKHWKSDLRVGGLEAASLCGQDCNLLCLSHIIEHLPNVRNSVGTALEGLRDGGYVFVEVPRYHERMFHPFLEMESHLHFFTPTSLVALLKSLGLSVIACLTCGPLTHLPANRERNSDSCAAPMIGWFRNRILVFLNQRDRIRTSYDGFYDAYYQTPEEGGIWVRCLARKKGKHDGSAGSHTC